MDEFETRSVARLRITRTSHLPKNLPQNPHPDGDVAGGEAHAQDQSANLCFVAVRGMTTRIASLVEDFVEQEGEALDVVCTGRLGDASAQVDSGLPHQL